MRKTVLVIVWSVLLIGGLQAQSAEKVWTLEECMRYAIENSHEVKKQQYTNANYRQDYISAVAQMMPSVSGSVDVSSNFGRSLDPATNTYASNVNFNNSYGVGASIGVFGGFTAINNLRLTKVARRQGEDELQKASDDISLSVMENYFLVVYYEGVVRMSEEQLEESRLKLRQTVEQEALGLKSRADVVQVEAEVATNDAALTSGQNNLTNYLTLLKTKMNYPLNDTLRIDTQVDLLAQEMSETAESIYFDARRQNPTAKIADFNLRQSRLRYSIAKGNYYPSLTISGGYQTNYFIADMDHTDQSPSFKNQFRDNRGEYIQASLSIPIFNSLSRRTNVNRSRNNMLIQEQNRNQTLQQLQSDIRKAVDDCQGYAKQYEQMKKRVEANQLAYDVMRRKYEEGLVSPLDLQTSANLLLSAKADQLKTKLDYIIQCRLVKYYKGIPLIEQLQ